MVYNERDVSVLSRFRVTTLVCVRSRGEVGRLTQVKATDRMATKLYVGGLPYSTTQDEIQTAFGKAGSVTSVSIIMDKMTGRSRGFGFVEMASDEDAQKAIEMWNGKDFDGRKLTVNEAKPLEARPPRREGGGGFGGGNGGGRRNSW